MIHHELTWVCFSWLSIFKQVTLWVPHLSKTDTHLLTLLATPLLWSSFLVHEGLLSRNNAVKPLPSSLGSEILVKRGQFELWPPLCGVDMVGLPLVRFENLSPPPWWQFDHDTFQASSFPICILQFLHCKITYLIYSKLHTCTFLNQQSHPG